MHLRKRHIQAILSKRSKIFPVLGIVGPRQVGKTTFLRQEWKMARGANYVTFDKFEVVKRAKREPENFLLSESDDLKKRLIIDEAQKVPAIFDSIKSIIDERRRVGIFTVSGSVEFSDKAGIRESLAGRMGVCRLYPLTLCEMAQQPLHTPWVKGWKTSVQKRTPKEIDTWLTRGGMPIFCALHDDAEIKSAIKSWLEAICYRDMQQLKGGRLDGDVALSILGSIARQPSVNMSQISDDSGASRTSVAKYLAALEALFLIHKLPSFNNRNAAPDYVIFDSAILRYLLGSGDEAFLRRQTMRTLIVNEILAQYEYGGESHPGLFSYYSRGGAELDIVLQDKKKIIGIEISVASDITPYRLRSIKSFLATHPSAHGIVLAPITEKFSSDGIDILPWTYIG
jgi:predicted AAA+ superfamily ATPase